MDNLISRKTLLNDLCTDREEGTFCFTDSQAEAADKIIMYVAKRIEVQPTIEAVPLDKLCEWLANSFSDPPCCTLENVRCKMECRGFTQMDYSECWRYVLTKWKERLDAEKET